MKRYIKNSEITAMAKNKSVSTSPKNWIYGYILYSLYLQNSAKFKFSTNGRSGTGDNSGYIIELVTNNKGIKDPITFQITAESNNSVYVEGGIPGSNHIDTSMTPNNVITTLLTF